MAALLENSFAFLDGEEDDAKIIEAAKPVAKKDAEEKETLKQQSEQAVKAAHRCPSALLSMRARRITLPRYIRRDIVVRKEKPDGAEQNDAGSKFSGGNGDGGSYEGVASNQGTNYRRDGNNNSVHSGSSNGSRDGDYYWNNGGNNGNYVGKNNSGNSLGIVDNDGWQISVRRRVGHRGQGRGYSGYTKGCAYKGQVATVDQIQSHDDITLEKAPKSGEFETDECHENGNGQNNWVLELSVISEKDLSSAQHAVDGENKSIVDEKHLDGDTAAEANSSDVESSGAEGDVADATTDGPKESKRS